tara:strand:- start:8693 stop:9901 length:1209 start_codon:yes stop_codon:yes gene_type:complete
MFLFTGLVFAVLSVVVLYFYTRNLLQSEVEESLFSTEARIHSALKDNPLEYTLPPISEIKKVTTLRSQILKDTLIYDPSQDEMELFRELSTFKNINNQNYKITVRTLVVESENILFAIGIANMVVFVLAFLFLFYFNTAGNLKIWHPFFENLKQMKSFSLQSNQPLKLVDSDVLEFSELKNEIEALTNKVKLDYETLKQFTEDVSHEIQNPLAIIQAKIDNIINDHAINDKQFEQITSVQKDIQRLKMLNKRLALLTKIDNNQFVNTEVVNLNTMVDNIIENFKELGVNLISCHFNAILNVSIDPFLAETLCTNLISNAIKHKGDHGDVLITIDKDILQISNFGNRPMQHPEKMFLRFYKEHKSNQSTGLGLAIVKKICDFYGFDLSYAYKAQKHIFSVEFN